MRKLLSISYFEHKTSDLVRRKMNFLLDPQERIMATAKRQKLAWFGHVTRHDSLPRPILQGTMGVGNAVVGRGNAGWTT